MMNQISRAGIVSGALLLIFCFAATVLQAQEQTTFGAKNPITNRVKIPVEIMTELKRDKLVKQCIGKKGAVKNNWFSAAAIDLNGDQITDYLVKAENSCLLGANLAPFWIFHNLTYRYSLVLRADALGLEILPETTEDYHNLKLSRATATNVSDSILKFDGTRYR